jgi:Tfp pilus assembly protein PilN
MTAKTREPRGRVAVLLHDGLRWQAGVYRRAGGQMKSDARTEAEGAYSPEPPEELLSWARKQGARRLRLVTWLDVQVVEQRLPRTLRIEEIRNALRYDAAGNSGQSPEDIAVAALQATDLYPGASPEAWVVASAATDEVYRAREISHQHKMVFEGIVPLQFAAMRGIADSGGPKACILMGPEQTFAAAAPPTGTPPIIRFVPCGTASRSEAGQQKLSRRLRSFADKVVEVVTIGPGGGEAAQSLASAVGFQPEENDWGEVREATMRAAAAAPPLFHAGGLAAGRGGRQLATVLAVAIVVLTLVGLAGTRVALKTVSAQYEERIRKATRVEQARTRARDRLAAARRQARGQKDLHQLLSGSRRIRGPVLPILNSLTQAIPEETWVTQIKQQEGGGVVMEGQTRSPQAPSRLAADMQRILEDEGVRVVSETASLGRDARGGAGQAGVFRLRFVPESSHEGS